MCRSMSFCSYFLTYFSQQSWEVRCIIYILQLKTLGYLVTRESEVEKEAETILPQRSNSLALESVAINCHKWNLKEIVEFGHAAYSHPFLDGLPLELAVLAWWCFLNKHTRAFQVNGDSWPCSFCWQIHLRNQKILLAASVFALLFHHFKSIPNILKYEVILISITTWTKNADHFQRIYKIFAFWNLSLLRDEKHQLTENALAAKSIITCWVLGTQFHRIAIFCFWGHLSFEMPALFLVRVLVWKLTSRKKVLGKGKKNHFSLRKKIYLSINQSIFLSIFLSTYLGMYVGR